MKYNLDPISNHLITRIINMWLNLSNNFDNKGFFYFNSPILCEKGLRMDRIGKGLIYFEDEIIPAVWKNIKGGDLNSIYNQMKNRELYFYREIEDGRFIKMKLKKK